MRPLQLLVLAQLREPRVGQPVAAEVRRQRLRHDHPPGGAHRDPVAVKRHFDAAVGAEVGVGLPGDVGQQARGEAQAAHRRRIVEQRRDPLVEQVAVLAEAMLAAAGIARRLDQRVELAAAA